LQPVSTYEEKRSPINAKLKKSITKFTAALWSKLQKSSFIKNGRNGQTMWKKMLPKQHRQHQPNPHMRRKRQQSLLQKSHSTPKPEPIQVIHAKHSTIKDTKIFSAFPYIPSFPSLPHQLSIKR
jgi:hypothetical protein